MDSHSIGIRDRTRLDRKFESSIFAARLVANDKSRRAAREDSEKQVPSEQYPDHEANDG